MGNDLWGSNGHVTDEGETRDPNVLRAQYLENSWKCNLATIVNYLHSLLLVTKRINSNGKFACSDQLTPKIPLFDLISAVYRISLLYAYESCTAGRRRLVS